MAVSKISDERLYVALDLPSIEQARAMVETLGDSVESYKIGLQLLPLGGAEFGQELKAMGKNVFYDFKLHDIGATVERPRALLTALARTCSRYMHGLMLWPRLPRGVVIAV